MVAKKREEQEPAIKPDNIAILKLNISCEPNIIKQIIGIKVVIEVKILRVNVDFILSFITSFNSSFFFIFFLLFFTSLILSNVTIVSFIEYPIIDKIAAINKVETSSLNILPTITVINTSCTNATIALIANENDKRNDI